MDLTTFKTPMFDERMKKIRQQLWKLGKWSKLDIKIQNFENLQNFIEEMDLTTFNTPSLTKEGRKSDKNRRS